MNHVEPIKMNDAVSAADYVKPYADQKDGLYLIIVEHPDFPADEVRLLGDIGESMGATVAKRCAVSSYGMGGGPVGVLFLSGIRIGQIRAKEVLHAWRTNVKPFRRG